MALKDVPGIMQAIGQLYNQQTQQADLAERVRSNKAEEGLRTQQMTQAQAIADRVADQASQRIELDRQIHEANIRQQAQNAVPQLMEALRNGADPKDVEDLYGVALHNLAPSLNPNSGSSSSPQQPQPQPQSSAPAAPALLPYRQQSTAPPSQSPTASTGTVDPSLGSRVISAEANRVRSLANAQTSGTEAALQPGRNQENAWRTSAAQAQFDREKELQQNGFTNETVQNDRKLANENHMRADEIAAGLQRTRMETGTQQAIHNAEMHTQLMIAGISPAGPNGEPSPTVQAATTAVLAGLKKPDFNNPIDRAAATAVINQGGRDVSGEGEQLKNLQQLNSIYDRMQEWNDKHGATSVAGQAINKAKQGAGSLSDDKQSYDSVMADFLKLAQGAEGANKGRVPVGQFSLEQGGAIKMANSKTANDKIIQQGRSRIKAMQDATVQGVPKFQQDIMKHTYGLDESPSATAPASGTTRMKAPTGEIDDIPNAKVNEAKAKGATVVTVQ